MIIDCHAHIASPLHLPDAFLDGWTENLSTQIAVETDSARVGQLRAMLRRLNDDPGCEDLLSQMDEAGIDRAVLLVIDFGCAFPETSDHLEAAHREVRALVKSGRFVGFAGIDPRRGEKGLAMLEEALGGWGLMGLKLYPPCGFSPSDPTLFPFYEICAQRGAPVLLHTGPTTARLPFRHAHPLEVDEAACSFPRVNFILAHAGVVWHEDAALLAEYRPNVYLDISGFQTELRRGGFANILRAHTKRGLARKLLFGTDWPIHRFFGTQADWVAAVREAAHEIGWSEAVTRDVLGGNLLRILPPEARPENVS